MDSYKSLLDEDDEFSGFNVKLVDARVYIIE